MYGWISSIFGYQPRTSGETSDLLTYVYMGMMGNSIIRMVSAS